MKRQGAVASALAVLALASVAFAGEKKVSRSEVPGPVIAAVEKRFPAAKMIGFEREEEAGKVVFEVQLQDGARRLDLDVSPDGKILSSEEAIPFQAAPEAVRKSVATSKYGKLDIKKAEKVLEYRDDRISSTSYEIALVGRDLRAWLVVDEAGKILKQKEAKPGQKNEKEEDD
jgi:hypothetical protein